MDKKLRDHIDELGGKNGALVYLRELTRGGDYVLPFEVLKAGDPYTSGTHRGVKAACREVGSDRVIVRTSEPTDFRGMVDAMPTEVVEMGWLSRHSIAKVIEQVRQRCAHPDVLKYAAVEGFGYDPKRVSVSVTPFSGYPHGLITEHPNQDGVRLVDQWEPYGGDFGNCNVSADFSGDRMAYRYSVTREFEKYLPVQEWIRDSGVLDPDMAYQFECGSGGRNPILFQVREFARKVKANFRVKNPKSVYMHRTFGVTPEEGIELVVARERSRRLLYEEVLPKLPQMQPFLLAPDNTHSRLLIDESPAPGLLGYATRDKPALSHQATRFVQAALRHQHGVAQLMDLRFYKKYKYGLPKIRVISDGIEQRVESAE